MFGGHALGCLHPNRETNTKEREIILLSTHNICYSLFIELNILPNFKICIVVRFHITISSRMDFGVESLSFYPDSEM